jgi:DNA-binding transcriptional LysR family regulator
MKPSDWEYLPFFLAVARAGNLRAAAALLNANYGTVNRNIQALEASYGVRLFTRSRKGFALTDAGDSLVPVAEEMERTVISARRQIEGRDKTETGTIRFSVTPTLAYDIVAPIIGTFHAKYPDIQVEMRITSEIESINTAETDISLRAAMDVTDDVVARKLYAMANGIFASKHYVETVVPLASPLGEGLDWIGFPGTDDPAAWLAATQFPHARIRHSIADGPMRIAMLRQHCGLSQLPVIFGKAHPDLMQVPGTEVKLGPSLWILLHTDLRRTVRVRRFVDHLSEGLLALKSDMQAGVK